MAAAGNSVAAALSDGTVQVYSVERNAALRRVSTVRGPKGPATAVGFGGSRSVLLLVAADGVRQASLAGTSETEQINVLTPRWTSTEVRCSLKCSTIVVACAALDPHSTLH